MIIYEPRRHTDNTTLTRYLKHINYEYELYVGCTLLTRPWGTACSTHGCRVETDTCTKKKKKKVCGHTPTPLRGPYSSTCFWAPSPHSTFYSAWFMLLYLWANRPKLTAPQKARRCTPKVHRGVTHTELSLSARREGSSPPNFHRFHGAPLHMAANS